MGRLSFQQAAAPGRGHETTETGPIRQDILTCLPERLHPISQSYLEHWLSGNVSTAEFLHWFHMPNSAYRSVAECVMALVAGA